MSSTVYYELEYGSIIRSTSNNVLWSSDPRAKRIPEKEAKQKLKARAKEALLKMINVNDTVYTVLDHVSRSGMIRHIRLFVVKDNRIWRITHYVADLLDFPRRQDVIVTNGYGEDQGSMLVHELSASLWPSGFVCIGKDCPSNEHRNGDRDYTPHMHTSSGYALRHSWI